MYRRLFFVDIIIAAPSETCIASPFDSPFVLRIDVFSKFRFVGFVVLNYDRLMELLIVDVFIHLPWRSRCLAAHSDFEYVIFITYPRATSDLRTYSWIFQELV